MKSILTTLLLGSFLLLPAASDVRKSASDQGVRGPVLGYIFDGDSRLLRPINGIPGAAHVAGAIDLGFIPSVVEVSPKQDFALAIDSEGQLRLVNLTSPVPTSTVVNSAIVGGDRIFISPSGLAAAIYDRESKTVQLVEGLPSSANPTSDFAIAALPGVVTALAVSDNSTVLAAVAERSGGSLYSLVSDREPVRIAPIRRALGLSFVPRSDDALVADFDASEILLARNVSTLGQVSEIASADDGVLKPRSVAASSDGTRAVALVPNGVATMRLSGGAAELTTCACSPTTLSPLAGGSAFRLTEAVGGPIHLVEVASEIRMLFVPAALDVEPAELTSSAPTRTASRSRR